MMIHLNDRLDQVWSNYPRFGIGIAEPDQHKAVAQTFTVNKPGVLTYIELALAEQFLNSTGPLEVDLRPVVAGLPGDDDSVLYRLVIPHGLLPDPEDADGTNEWFSLPIFPAQPLVVTRGLQLAVVLRAQSGGFYGAWGSSSRGGAPQYTGGEAYWRHDTHTGGRWQTLATSGGERMDFWFRTRITDPAARPPL